MNVFMFKVGAALCRDGGPEKAMQHSYRGIKPLLPLGLWNFGSTAGISP